MLLICYNVHVKNQDPIATKEETTVRGFTSTFSGYKALQIFIDCSKKNLLITCLYKTIIYFFNCSIWNRTPRKIIPVFFKRLKSDFSLSDRYKLFTNDWLWIEVCQNAVFSKIDITMTTTNQKTLKSIKSENGPSRPAAENSTTET